MSDLVPRVDLRLPSRAVPQSLRERRMLQREEANALAVERVRANVQLARIHHVTVIASEAIRNATTISSLAENAAAVVPHERQRGDQIADAAAGILLSLVTEAGR